MPGFNFPLNGWEKQHCFEPGLTRIQYAGNYRLSVRYNEYYLYMVHFEALKKLLACKDLIRCLTI